MSAAIEWGSTADERAASYPCEDFVPDADIAVYRAIDIGAPVPVVYRWLCQLRVAPYSYDLLDNLGRRSPRELTPGADELDKGQRVMTIFHLASFEKDRHLTIVCDGIGRRLLLLFADSGERAFVQATMMGGVAVVITSMLLLLWFLDNPYHSGLGGLRPTAMERTLEIVDQGQLVGGTIQLPCHANGTSR